MKTIKLTFILICSLLFAISNLQAQAPEKINYQAVARNLAGLPLVNQTINVKYEIRQGTSTGAVVYAENHTLTTNQFGLFTAQIGGGTPITGTFPGIAWGTSPFYLFVEVDGDPMGVTQLLSVPYALYAKESANGPAGLPGKNSLSLSTPYSGPTCINGGTQVDAGLDDNNDGTLQPLEIDYTYIICNGTNGTNGTNGLPGTNGIDGISIDSTINNNDGTFSIYYSNGTSFTTSDLTGPAGTSGTTYFAGNGISLSGDTITNLGDLDNNSTNELQILSVSNDTIFLSNGGFAPLPSAGGFWTQLGNTIHNNNPGNVGIGTNTPIHQLSVASNDSVVASFLGTDPNVAAILVGNVNASAATGIVFFNGVDTTSFIFLTPTTNSLTIRNNSLMGNILISTDSIIVNQGLILVNQAQNSIYNAADTIYSYSPSGTIVNVNQGMFLTDSLYVLGNNAADTNWILANDGFGQAKWTDPSTIVGSVGDNWGSQVVIHDTTLTGTGIAGTPLSVNPNIIPTQTSQLTNNSGFITSPNDGDTSITNELQVLSFNNDTLYLSNGNAIYLPPAAGDSWGSDSVITSGANISGSGTSANPLMILDNDTSATNELQVLSFNNDTLYLSNGNAVYLPPAAGDSWGSDSVITVGANISGSGTSANPLMVLDNDTSATNEIQTLSLIGDSLSISSSNSVDLSTLSGTTYTAGAGINLTGDSITNTAPDQTVVITGGGTTSVTSAYPSFIVTTTDNDTSATNEIQNLSNTISPGTVTIDITGGASTTFSIDDADANPSNELITSFGVNGTSDSLVIKEAGNDWSVPLSSLSTTANAWNLTGNALTNTATDFIGTIDNKSLNFRVFNQKAGKIDNGLYVAFFGFQAGNANTTGGNNNAFGTQAMFSNTTGGSNNAFGWAALYSNTGGQANTALGEEALYSTVSSNYNTGVGYEALYFSTGANNTGVGSFAGDNNITGSSNTFLGYNADANWDNLINATAIGANALVMTSNTVQLGAGADIDFDRALMPNGDPGTSGYLLSSQGAGVAPIWVDPSTISTSLWTDGGANTYLTSLTDNVGIGTNNPLSKLHIQGTSDPLEVVLENGGGAFKTGYSVKTGAGQSWFMGKELTPDFVIKDETVGQVRLQIATNGNVGIGTISPESMLHVALPNTANHKAFQLGHGNQTTLEWLFKVDEFSLFSIANENNGTEFTAMVIDANNGNVGIGTTTANSRLDVQNADNNVHAFSSIHTGTNAHAGYFKINNAANNLNAINATTNGAGAAINASNNYNGANAIRDGIYVTVTGAGGAGTVNKAGYFSAIGASNNYAAIFDQGNVGIGTGAPSAKLHLEGSLRLNNIGGLAPANGLVLTAIDAAGNAEWQPPTATTTYWSPNGADIYNNNAGNVGIGTTTPLFPLEIITSTQLRGAQIQNTFPSPNPKYGIYAVASGTGVGDNIGGWFDATGSSSINYGIGAQAIGVAGTGENRAIYGNASTGSINWAGYFDNGNVYIKNQLNVGTINAGTNVNVSSAAVGGTGLQLENTNAGGKKYRIVSTGTSSTGGVGLFQIYDFDNGMVRLTVNAIGNVGIGTTAPTSKLEVANSTLNNTAKIENTFNANVQKEAVYGITSGSGTGANIGGKFEATGGGGSNYGVQAAAYSNIAGATNYGVYGTATNAPTNIGGFFRASGGSVNYALIVPSGGGNVGIGTSTPGAILDVAGTTKLGTSGTSFSGLLHGIVAVNPPSINGGLSTTFNITVTGAAIGDLIFFTPPAGFDNSIIYQGAEISAANTIIIKVKNVSGSPVDALATNWSYLIVRP